MSVTVTLATHSTSKQHEDGASLNVNDDGSLVVFDQHTASKPSKRIAVYAAGHWSRASVDTTPSPYSAEAKIQRINEYLEKAHGTAVEQDLGWLQRVIDDLDEILTHQDDAAPRQFTIKNPNVPSTEHQEQAARQGARIVKDTPQA